MIDLKNELFGRGLTEAEADRVRRSPDLGWPAGIVEEARNVRHAAMRERLHPDELSDQWRNPRALDRKPLSVIQRIRLGIAALNRLYHWHRPADQADRNEAIRKIEALMARLRGDA
ncbi:hypothetical protein [Paracoccus hibiscisoli]|uniref:Uncharacterized protein n=1 Tax=Paracoccus hibiscisoli TaxID=2023261 RepID=A0A4U0QVH3_9RHOB|nr:hypothetical protein [Paracoccus hibiscisoli]TJZ86137.1 hypothetical protein FA740_04415 [Paracoccus hibiscisoli]